MFIKIPDNIKEYSKWDGVNKFISKLKAVQTLLKHNNAFTSQKKSFVCVLCKKNIKLGIYKSKKYSWDTRLYHMVREHNFKPDSDFIEFITEYNIYLPTQVKRIVKFNSVEYSVGDLKYVKMTKNQLMILDALMEHGGYSKKYHSYSRKKLYYKHSEHSGLLDFDNSGLERVIVSGRTDRKDTTDTDIFLPQNMDDAIDYEYIFHTHPPTPYPGGRVTSGILYEFPSISDLFHFIDHFNDGITQGSIIVAPEGLYNIHKKVFDGKKLNIDEPQLLAKMKNVIFDAQDKAIEVYGTKFTKETFYSKIAQDLTYINLVNDGLEEFNLHIDYFPRIKDNNNRWILNDVRLPIFIVEKHEKNRKTKKSK